MKMKEYKLVIIGSDPTGWYKIMILISSTRLFLVCESQTFINNILETYCQRMINSAFIGHS